MARLVRDGRRLRLSRRLLPPQANLPTMGRKNFLPRLPCVDDPQIVHYHPRARYLPNRTPASRRNING